MVTKMPPALSKVYGWIGPYLSSDKNGGIVNPNSPGYHTSREDLIRQGRSGDYSIQAPADKRGDAQYAAGIDITLSDAEMKIVTGRLRKACTPVNGVYDARIECIREFIGTTDGKNVQGYNRYAHGTGSRGTVGWKTSGFSDKSHLWHVHISVFRDRVNNENDMRGLAEVIAGLNPGTLGWSDTGKVVEPPVVDNPPVVVPPVVLYPEPNNNDVYIEKLVSGQKDSDSVWRVQDALLKLSAKKVGYSTDIVRSGNYNAETIDAVKKYQAWLGDDVKYQDGLIGAKQVERLFKEIGTSVNIIPKAIVTPPKPTTPEKPTTEPKPEDPKVATETIAGWNILRRTDVEPGRKRWGTRRPLIGKHLRDAKATVYLLNETDSSTRQDCAEELGSKFNFWGFKYYGIYWHTDVWERAGDATNEFEFRDNNNRFLLSLPLRHKATGIVITFDCTHLENDGDPKTDGHNARFVESTHLSEKAKTGRRVGFWDCNSTTPPVVANPTAREKQKPRVVLRDKIKAKFLSEIKSKVKNGEYASHHGGKGSAPKGPWIDDAWTVGDVSFVDGELVRTDGTDASDHDMLKFRIKF